MTEQQWFHGRRRVPGRVASQPVEPHQPGDGSEDPIDEVERRARTDALASEPRFASLRALGLYPLLALSGLLVARQLVGGAIVVLGPEITRDLLGR